MVRVNNLFTDGNVCLVFFAPNIWAFWAIGKSALNRSEEKKR